MTGSSAGGGGWGETDDGWATPGEDGAATSGAADEPPARWVVTAAGWAVPLSIVWGFLASVFGLVLLGSFRTLVALLVVVPAAWLFTGWFLLAHPDDPAAEAIALPLGSPLGRWLLDSPDRLRLVGVALLVLGVGLLAWVLYVIVSFA